MSSEEINKRFEHITDIDFDFNGFFTALKSTKLEKVAQNDQVSAKEIWCYETILHIHHEFRAVFELFQLKEFYKAWCKLEQIELTFSSLKRHFSYPNNEFLLRQLEKTVQNLQIIFPYRLFASSEILKKRKICSICNAEISIRRDCGHRIGEIYDGEMCSRTVTEWEMLGIALVENPANKYSVMFLVDEETGDQYDQYSYDVIEYLLSAIKSPYEIWDLETKTKEAPIAKVGRNDPCPCENGKKFKNCCLNKPGEKYTHFEFILKNPPTGTIYSNTLKNKKPIHGKY